MRYFRIHPGKCSVDTGHIWQMKEHCCSSILDHKGLKEVKRENRVSFVAVGELT